MSEIQSIIVIAYTVLLCQKSLRVATEEVFTWDIKLFRTVKTSRRGGENRGNWSK